MDLGTCEYAPPVSEHLRPEPCFTLMLHPLRPSALKTARVRLARLGYLSIPGFTRRGRRIIRRPGRRVIAADSLLLTIASFVSDAATLVALSRSCKHADALLARAASPLAHEIWDRLLARDFRLSASALREAKLAHVPMADGHVSRVAHESAGPASVPYDDAAGDCECDTAGAGCGRSPCCRRSRASFPAGCTGAGAGAGAGAVSGVSLVSAVITHVATATEHSVSSAADTATAAAAVSDDVDDDDDVDEDDGADEKGEGADTSFASAGAASDTPAAAEDAGPASSGHVGSADSGASAACDTGGTRGAAASTASARIGADGGAGGHAGVAAGGSGGASTVKFSSSAGAGLPPLCASKRVYGLLVQGRGDVYRAAEVRRAMEQLHRAGTAGIDSSVWSSVLHATGLGRFTPAAMPGFGAGGLFARWFG